MRFVLVILAASALCPFRVPLSLPQHLRWARVLYQMRSTKPFVLDEKYKTFLQWVFGGLLFMGWSFSFIKTIGKVGRVTSKPPGFQTSLSLPPLCSNEQSDFPQTLKISELKQHNHLLISLLIQWHEKPKLTKRQSPLPMHWNNHSPPR